MTSHILAININIMAMAGCCGREFAQCRKPETLNLTGSENHKHGEAPVARAATEFQVKTSSDTTIHNPAALFVVLCRWCSIHSENYTP